MEGSATLSAGDFKRFYDFAENAYKNDPYRGYYEEVCDGSTYGFTYYPLGISQGVHLFGGDCYSNKELWEMIELAYSYFG